MCNTGLLPSQGPHQTLAAEVLEKGDRYRLTLTATVPDDAAEGFRSTRFLIRTDHPEAPTLEPSFSIHVIDR